MKLAVLTTGMLPIPAVRGGAVENLIDFYLEYNDTHKLHDITVYSPWDSEVKTHPALVSDVNHYHYIDVTNLISRIARKIYSYCHHDEYYNYFIEYYFEKVYADLKKKDFDYIILENGAGLAYKLSQRGYKNLILHMHNEVQPFKDKFHQVAFKNIIKIITVSDYIKQGITNLIPVKKIETVYNGIDLKCFTRKEVSHLCRSQLGFADDDFVIVYSGRINKDKGVSELIEAMLQLESPKIKLMVLGSSFFNNSKNEDTFTLSLKNKAKTIKGRIVFTGFIPYQQVPNYLQMADLAVLPSIWEEPFGLTIVEAMAIGLPLITTQSGGIPEICEGVATIIDKNNIVNNLTSAILFLYQHPEKRKQMTEASLKRSVLFDKEIYAKNFFAALERI